MRYEHDHRVKGTFGSAFGGSVGCVLGAAFALALLVFGSIAGCVFLVGGCTAVGSRAVQEAGDQPVQTDRREPGPEFAPRKSPPSLPRRAVALKEPVTIDGITVRITDVRLGKATLETRLGINRTSRYESDETYLLVGAEVTARSKTRRYEYATWRDVGLLNKRLLRDEHGNEYRTFYGSTTSDLVGGIGYASLYDGQTATDLLVFERPVAAAERLELDLPGAKVGVKGDFRFLIPKSAWTTPPEPVQPAVERPASTPPVEKKPEPEPDSSKGVEPPPVAAKPSRQKPRPRPPEPKPDPNERTIVPDGKGPVPLATDPSTLAVYTRALAARRTATTDKLIADGVVQLVTAPTKVRYEQTLKGLAYVRLPDGPLKDRLAVVDAAFVKE